MSEASLQPVHEQIRALAKAQGEAPALFFEDRELSFAELDLRANRVAHALRALKVGPESVVALLGNRSPELIVGLLGILKAGAAYLPLDPGYPLERLNYMLADAGVCVIVGDRTAVDLLPESSLPFLLVE